MRHTGNRILIAGEREHDHGCKQIYHTSGENGVSLSSVPYYFCGI